MNALLAVLAASTKATVQFLLLACAGALAAFFPRKDPLLSSKKVSFLARLANDIFLPCWTLSTIGARIKLRDLRKEWAIILFGFFVSFFGYFIADLLSIVFRPRKDMIPAMRVAIAQVNALAVPLVLIDSLCETSRVNYEFDSDSTDCKFDAAAKLNIFMIGWHTTFWSYGIATLSRTDQLTNKNNADVNFGYGNILTQPNLLALLLGLFVAITPLGRLLFREKKPSPLRPLGAALQVLAWPMLATTVLITAAALVHGHVRKQQRQGEEQCGIELSPSSSPVRQQDNHIINIDHIEDERIHDVPIRNNDDDLDDTSNRYVATMFWFILSRLFFVPLVGYALAYVTFQKRTFGLSKLARLVILMEFAAPSAQTILTVLYALGLGRVAESLAPYYFIMYLSSIFTMTAFGAFALYVIYYS